MNNSLQIWIGPIMSLLGVILGFIATAVFNKSEYQKQIKILEMKTEKQFIELKKQKNLEQQYFLLDRSLSSIQGDINAEKAAISTYTQLRLEFVRISSLVKLIMEKNDDYTNLPKIETIIYSMLTDPSNLQMNVLSAVMDVYIFIEEYNSEELTKENKKEVLKKIARRADDGNNDCIDATNNSLIKMGKHKRDYMEQIIKFNNDGTIYIN